MLKSNDSWSWYFDNDHQALLLDLGQDLLFKVAISPKQLINTCMSGNSQVFTVDDATQYRFFLECLSDIEMPSSRKMELVLNATAICRFQKPLMPKSWFFQSLDSTYIPTVGECILLSTSQDDLQHPFFVVESNETASLVLSMSIDPFFLSNEKPFVFCQTIKVMNDRIQAMPTAMMTNYALVG